MEESMGGEWNWLRIVFNVHLWYSYVEYLGSTITVSYLAIIL